MNRLKPLDTLIKKIFYARSILALIVLCIDILISRVYGPEGKGIYAVLILLAGVLSFLIQFGGEGAINALGHRNRSSLYFIVREVVILSGKIYLFIGFIFCVAHLLILDGGLKYGGESLLYSFLAAPFISLMFLVAMALTTQGEPVISLSVRIVYRMFVFIFILLFISIFDSDYIHSVPVLISINIVGLVFASVVGWTYLNRQLSVAIEKSVIYRKCYQSYLFRIGEFLQDRMPALVASLLLDLKGVGLLSVSLALAESLYLVSTSVSSHLFSKRLSKIHTQVVGYLLPILIVLSILIGFASQLIVPLVWGGEFKESSVILLFFLPGVISNSIVHSLTPYIIQMSLNKNLNYSRFISLIVFFLLVIPLSDEFGVIGVAIASTLSGIAMMLLVVGMICRSESVSFKYIFKLRNPLRVLE